MPSPRTTLCVMVCSWSHVLGERLCATPVWQLRQHQALERAQIHEEDAVKDILAKQEKKFRLSEKVWLVVVCVCVCEHTSSGAEAPFPGSS